MRIILLLLLLLMLPAVSWPACVGPDLSSVQTAVDSAAREGTVDICAGDGTETWDATLATTKGIVITGPGYENLVITSARDQAITYYPDATAIANNELFDISGFTLDLGGVNTSVGAMYLEGGLSDDFVTNVKIHDMKFLNSAGKAITSENHMQGVIYNVVWDNVQYIVGLYGADDSTWTRVAKEFGSDNDSSWYLEDNTIQWTDCSGTAGDCGEGRITNGQGLAGLVLRYNTYDYTNNTERSDPIDVHGLQSMAQTYDFEGTVTGGSTTTLIDTTLNFVALGVVVGDTAFNTSRGNQGIVTSITTTTNTNDTLNFTVMDESNAAGDTYQVTEFHCAGVDNDWDGCGYESCTPTRVGSCDETIQAAAQWSTIKSEVYGNIWTNGADQADLVGIRGGGAFMFNNRWTGVHSPDIIINDYSCDEAQTPALGYHQEVGLPGYFWNNWTNGTIEEAQIGFDWCGGASVGTPHTSTENVDWYNYNATEVDGATEQGINAGSVVPTSDCTTGDGYWKTDYSTPSTPPTTIADMRTYSQAGTFYKCVTEDTWEEYYTPYAYPHPLRNPLPTLYVDEAGNPLL